jgi:hypothetical protein
MMQRLIFLSILIWSFSAVPVFAQAPNEAPVSAVQPSPAAPEPPPSAPVENAQQGAAPSVAPEKAPMADGTAVASTPPANEANGSLIPEPETEIEKAINEQLSFQKPGIDINAMQSLFFTVWEHDLIIDARRGLNTRTLDAPDDGVDAGNQQPVTGGPRDIALGGIVYKGTKDWVIWLNSLRIAPDAIPSEVVDLKVYKEYIELEWFDRTTNQIYPIRLRPHQRFNLDTRMFLPG